MNISSIISASLDPRFRKLTFLAKEQWDKLRDILVDKATTNCSGTSSLDSCSQDKETKYAGPVILQKKFWNILKNVLLNRLMILLCGGEVTLTYILD